MVRFESVPYLPECVCQIWLRSDGRECNAGMTIAKYTKTAASSNDIFLERPAARFARGTIHLVYLYTYRVMPTHDLNAILYPPSSEYTVGCIAV